MVSGSLFEWCHFHESNESNVLNPLGRVEYIFLGGWEGEGEGRGGEGEGRGGEYLFIEGL